MRSYCTFLLQKIYKSCVRGDTAGVHKMHARVCVCACCSVARVLHVCCMCVAGVRNHVIGTNRCSGGRLRSRWSWRSIAFIGESTAGGGGCCCCCCWRWCWPNRGEGDALGRCTRSTCSCRSRWLSTATGLIPPPWCTAAAPGVNAFPAPPPPPPPPLPPPLSLLSLALSKC